MRSLYTLLWILLLPLVCLRLLWRSRRQPEYRGRMAERFGFYSANKTPTANKTANKTPTKPLVWLHAVSVGEFLAALPLIEHLLARGDCQLLITTTTPTGSAQVHAKLGERVLHVYAPYDIPWIIDRLLNQFRPALLLVMETELWPNLLRRCRQKGINSVLVNGRMSARSARGYQRFSALTRPMLQDLTGALVQYPADGLRLVELGLPAERLQVCGSVKFDVTVSDQQRQQAQTLRSQWPRPLAWLAASTHPGEEEQVLQAQRKLQQGGQTPLLILVPRHPERAQEVLNLCTDFNVVRRSSGEPVTEQTDVLLVDTLGELMTFYGAADIALVGGSLIAHGGHNLVEPAVWAKPVISGPSVFNFATMAENMTAANALITVNNAQQLAQTIQQLASHPDQAHAQGLRAADFAQANRGALQRVLMALAGYLDEV